MYAGITGFCFEDATYDEKFENVTLEECCDAAW